MIKKEFTLKIIFVSILLMLVLSTVATSRRKKEEVVKTASGSVSMANNKAERIFTPEELSSFNGDNPAKPIYIGLDGYVYDVSQGKEFYKPGASYHDLAGKDSSDLLHIAGGDIIKRKYPIVGKLSASKTVPEINR